MLHFLGHQLMSPLRTIASRPTPLGAALVLALTTAAMSAPQRIRESGVIARLTVGGRTNFGSQTRSAELQSMVIDCRIATPRGQARRDFAVDFGFLRSDPRIRNSTTLNHVRLEIPDVRDSGVATRFYLEATFGDPGDPRSRTMHIVNTRSADGTLYGSGSVTITRSGDAGRFVIDARTRDGVPLTGTIDCSNIAEG